MKVYISGPIAIDPIGARRKFLAALEALQDLGHEAVNPFDVEPCGDLSCQQAPIQRKEPHTDHTRDCHLRHDLIEMLKCDGVATLPNWQMSEGATLEVVVALQTRMVVKSLEEWLS
jgi:hypothetical protein